MATDALDPCVVRASSAAVLNTEDKWIPIFHNELQYLSEKYKLQINWSWQKLDVLPTRIENDVINM